MNLNKKFSEVEMKITKKKSFEKHMTSCQGNEK